MFPLSAKLFGYILLYAHRSLDVDQLSPELNDLVELDKSRYSTRRLCNTRVQSQGQVDDTRLAGASPMVGHDGRFSFGEKQTKNNRRNGYAYCLQVFRSTRWGFTPDDAWQADTVHTPESVFKHLRCREAAGLIQGKMKGPPVVRPRASRARAATPTGGERSTTSSCPSISISVPIHPPSFRSPSSPLPSWLVAAVCKCARVPFCIALCSTGSPLEIGPPPRQTFLVAGSFF